MFTLVKILNSHSNIPTIENIKITPCTEYKKGRVYFMNYDGVSTERSNSVGWVPIILLEDIGENDGRKTASGFQLTEDMIFELTVEPINAKNLMVGEKCSFLYDDQDNSIFSITRGDDADVLVVENNRDGTNKLRVRMLF